MRAAHDEWSFWFPDEGQTEADAIPIIGRIFDAHHAATEACEYDWGSMDGWERGEVDFEAVVRSPEGEQTTFVLCHQPTVTHTAVKK